MGVSIVRLLGGGYADDFDYLADLDAGRSFTRLAA
jgi:hypothetical protein